MSKTSENREFFKKALQEAIEEMFEEEMADIDPDIDASVPDDYKRKMNALLRQIDPNGKVPYPEVDIQEEQ